MTPKCIGVAAVAALALPAFAQTIVFSGDISNSSEQTGSTYSGSIDYDSGAQEVTISLTNDTPIGVGGRLVAFAFRIESSDPGASATLINSTLASFTNIPAMINAGSFGDYHAGAGLSGNFLGGGNPNSGLAIGASATFVFSVSASDAGSLTTADFFAPSEGFLARFRGLNDGGSDQVPAVPTPAAAITLAMAGGLVGGARRRR
jgi:hypothetical protein